jgi:uncharacterized membrane protein
MSSFAPSTSALQIRLRELSETYWFWPLSLGLGGLIVALLVLAADRSFTAKAFYEAYPWISVPPESARAVLTVIAGAMISAASIVYSLSLLIRTIAIGTLGPRLIEAFDKVRVNRVTLGVQLFSFVYSLTVLYSVGNIIEPHTLSVAAGVGVAVVALVYLVVFVHSVARQAHVDATIADIAGVLLRRIERETNDDAERGLRPSGEKGAPVAAPRSGYVQGIDRQSAFQIACGEDVAVSYEYRSGDYVVAGMPLLRVRSRKKPSDELCKSLAGTVTIGAQRIDAEDLRFQCLLLVEVALRALSPGINDPFTAVACIDNLSSVLARVGGRDLTPESLADEKGNARVVSRELSYQDLVDAIFHPLRQSGARIPIAAICMLERIGDLVSVTQGSEARKHLARHGELIATAACATTEDAGDRKTFEERLATINAALERDPESLRSPD